jgi:ribonuclease HII
MKSNLDLFYYQQGYQTIAGCDEAGRGPLAGPVVASAVILPQSFHHEILNDSKQMTAKQRDMLFDIIMEHAIAYSVAMIDVATIDRINILEASRLAMKTALNKLKHPFDLVVTDAMKISGIKVPVIPIIHGDALSQTIAASSVLAKVTRDRWMAKLHQQYPHFNFAKHKGYPTAQHQRYLQQFGPIPGVHRMSFAPVKRLVKIV